MKFDEGNEFLADVANTIRYTLSYSKNREEFFKNLIRRGILVFPENDHEIIFKTQFNTVSNQYIAEVLKDDFFWIESLKENLGYNVKEKLLERDLA